MRAAEYPATEHPATERAVRAFVETYGERPTHLVRAPARVNLIGEHTDYNDGFCLPVAIDRELCIALRRNEAPELRLVSEQDAVPAVIPLPPPGLDTPVSARAPGWVRYVEGVAVMLAAESASRAAAGSGGSRAAAGSGFPAGGGLVPWRGTLASDIPVGAGLSSSAALELAVALAGAHLAGLTPAPTELALLAQRAENLWVGAATGLLDQFACAAGVAGHALRIDCRTLTTEPVPLPGGLAVVIIDTGSRRQVVTSEYATRRAECERAARALGVAALRDLTPRSMDEAVARLGRSARSDGTTRPGGAAGGTGPDPVALDPVALDPAALRRARFVVAENARVDAVAAALRAGDAPTAGRLLLAGHRGIREDFEVSGPELDAAVQAASAAPGCFGARMTGGGFAGCAVALVDRSRLTAFTDAFEPAYTALTDRRAVLHVCSAVAGTSVLDLG
ncbi:galactokinase [Frankia sp. B2]|uniref:galactokinase n=1 Tax=Frankia sp. B2 TaxID=2541730 RepID=UPI00106C9B2A|nr:galactokinase [Frankia sp. B2]TFE25667.1 galactokinase [Frankia sp. B2]